jgi:magnesium chelatase subunit H
LADAEPLWKQDTPAAIDARVAVLAEQLLEMEYTLIPHGLHVTGRAPSPAERMDLLVSMADAGHGQTLSRASAQALVDGLSTDKVLQLSQWPRDEAHLAMVNKLSEANQLMSQETEVKAILNALDGHYVRPAPGGDVLRTPEVLPTGRNLHGFDPFRIPSAFAVKDGAKQAQRLLDRWKAWEIGGAICSEMEASTLFVLASMLRVRAGGIMVMHGEGELGSLEPLIETAVLALRELIKGDQNA